MHILALNCLGISLLLDILCVLLIIIESWVHWMHILALNCLGISLLWTFSVFCLLSLRDNLRSEFEIICSSA